MNCHTPSLQEQSPKLDMRLNPLTPTERPVRSSLAVPVYLWLFMFSVIHMADSEGSF